jgi:hypothetical protein
MHTYENTLNVFWQQAADEWVLIERFQDFNSLHIIISGLFYVASLEWERK